MTGWTIELSKFDMMYETRYEGIGVGQLCQRLAKELGARMLMVKSDSQLVTRQAQIGTFKEFTLLYVLREQNERADLLAKLASTQKGGRITIEETMVFCVEWWPSWRDPIITKTWYRKILKRHEESKGKRLNMWGFSYPLLQCCGKAEVERTIKKVHEGVCDSHIGGRALANKIARARFYWLTIKKDNLAFCYSDRYQAPPEQLHSLTSLWPFYMWGVDILGPFPLAVSHVKFLLVVVDYFTKWIEVEPVATISAERVRHFYWRKIICRFGLPIVILFTSIEHPQSNGRRRLPTELSSKNYVSDLKSNGRRRIKKS
ncbi:hypothetical protein CR513_13458, partial [Mucuna pruriens]